MRTDKNPAARQLGNYLSNAIDNFIGIINFVDVPHLWNKDLISPLYEQDTKDFYAGQNAYF